MIAQIARAGGSWRPLAFVAAFLLALGLAAWFWFGPAWPFRATARRDVEAVAQGRAHLQAGHPRLALRAVASVDERGRSAAAALTVRGMAWAALGQVEECRRALEESLELDPGQPMAAKVLAAVYFSRHRVGRGLELLEAAARLDPGDFRPWYAMGDMYRRLDRPEDAARMFRRALELSPDERDSGLGLARALLELGRTDEAGSALGGLLERGPADPEVLGLAARQARESGRSDEALRLADACLTIDGGNVEALLTRARLRQAAGDLAGGLDDAERAIAAAPNDVTGLFLLGTLQATAGRASASRATFDHHREVTARIGRMRELAREIEARPDDPGPMWRFGHEALEGGERSLAEQSFRAALAIDPTCEPAQRGLESAGAGSAPGVLSSGE